MNDRHTPETDELAKRQYIKLACSSNNVVCLLNDFLDETEDHARKLERERNEANAKLNIKYIEYDKLFDEAEKIRQERDEAKESLKHIEEYGTEEINAAIELRQKLAQTLIERDEAREQLSATKHFLEKYIAERDEAIAEIQRLRYDAQREAEHHDRLVKELEGLYDKLKS